MPTLTYGSEKWTWNEGQRFEIQAVEMSYLKGACGVNGMAGESNECVYGRLIGKYVKGGGMKCGAVEVVKRDTLGGLVTCRE